jgi:hypothetical protein
MDEAEGHSPEQAEKCGDQKTTTWWRGLSLNVRTSCLQDLGASISIWSFSESTGQYGGLGSIPCSSASSSGHNAFRVLAIQ